MPAKTWHGQACGVTEGALSVTLRAPDVIYSSYNAELLIRWHGVEVENLRQYLLPYKLDIRAPRGPEGGGSLSGGEHEWRGGFVSGMANR